MLRIIIVAMIVFVATQSFSKVGAAEVQERWAVLIGVDDYAHLHKLKYCGADQRELRDVLLQTGFDVDHVFLLHDEAEDVRLRPTKENIEKVLNQLQQQVRPNDLIVFGFSGHGIFTDDAYLCPVDSSVETAESMIAVKWITDCLAKTEAVMRFALVDACRNDPLSKGRREKFQPLMPSQLQESLNSWMLCTSCAAGQVSWEDAELGHGVFMYFVIEAYAGAADSNDNGQVTGGEFYDYVSRETKVYVAGKFAETQVPQQRGEMNGIFIVSRANSAKDGWPKRRSARDGSTSAVIGTTSSAGEFAGKLDIRVLRGDGNLLLTDPSALPVRNGDRIRIDATVNRDAYLYLLRIDSEGKPTRLDDRATGATAKRRELHSPTQLDQGYEMVGAPGLETVVLLAADKPLPADADLATIIGTLPPSGPSSSEGFLAFDVTNRPQSATSSGVKMTDQIGESRGLGGTKTINDPVIQSLQRLRERFDLVKAVRFVRLTEP